MFCMFWCLVNSASEQSGSSCFQVTVKLDLKRNSFQMLPGGAFLHTPYLTHLSLQRCSVVTVKEGAFRGLGRVVYLNLAYNKIDILYQVRWEGKEPYGFLLVVSGEVELKDYLCLSCRNPLTASRPWRSCTWTTTVSRRSGLEPSRSSAFSTCWLSPTTTWFTSPTWPSRYQKRKTPSG